MSSEDSTVGSIPIGSSAFFKAVVETSVDPFVVIDADFILRYASPSIELLLGWPPDDWIGRSIAELLEPDSLEVALQGLAELAPSPRSSAGTTPAVRIFLEDASGDHVAVDVLALDSSHTGIDGYVVQIHRAAGAQALSDAVDTILGGEDLDRALWQLTSLIEHDISRTLAVLGGDWDGDRFRMVAGDHDLIQLDDPLPADQDAIRFGLRSGRSVTDVFGRLDPTTRDRAAEVGMQACWFAPVLGDDFTAALLVWHTEPGSPGVIYQVDIDRAVNLTRLALQWRSQQRRLAWEVSHDQLTGLTNRGEFQNALDASSGQPRAVLYCDLDDFKPVNERFGHRVGDRVLSAVAGRLRGVCDHCVVARLGGDEFAILLEDLADLDRALEVADAVRSALLAPIAVGSHRAELGVTIGVAHDPIGSAHSDLLLDEADRLLRNGKSQGKNQVLAGVLDA